MKRNKIVKEITLQQIQNNVDETMFNALYPKMFFKEAPTFSDGDRVFLLKTALVFLNFGDKGLRKLGYRIIVRYGNLFNDYTPLYDVAINLGYIPIAKFIQAKHIGEDNNEDKFYNSFMYSHIESYKIQNYYLSYGQRILAEFSRSNKENYVLVAPTSYGKSEMLISKVLERKNDKICIIVPTKALLAQTKRRLLANREIGKHFRRIITHPEMYKGTETNFVAVLTQERLLRLLQKNENLFIDCLLLDEAHNLLKNDERAILLGQVLLIVKKRNAKTSFNFFTPFISESKSLELIHSNYKLDYKATSESIKVEKFFLYEVKKDKKVHLYDQFLNTRTVISDDTYKDEIDVIHAKKAAKNIIYLNRPRDIEAFALLLVKQNIKISDKLEEVFAAISDFLHPDYNLLKCIRGGIVYHHGGMPEIIRLYVENIFSEHLDLCHIITNSTLLEGVNIPAERMFLLTTGIGRRNFNKSEFKNLIGRVCRFSEVFNQTKGNLRMLEPEIYLLVGKFSRAKANIDTFLKSHARANVKIVDEIKNVLIKPEKTAEDKKMAKAALEVLENIEPNTVEVNGISYAKTEIGKLCYKNNISEFDIRLNENKLNSRVSKWKGKLIDNEETLIEAIYDVFLKEIEITKAELERFENAAARKFYTMVLSWRTKGTSYKQLIARFLNYWETLTNKMVYAGSRWGEEPFDENSRNNLYVNLNKKTETQKINLAIVRIKEEQDLVDNNLIKFVEVLFDLELVEKKFYERIKYGSSDQKIICLLKNGFSIELSKTITKIIYRPFVQIDPVKDEILIQPGIISQMEAAGENKILIFEIGYHLN